LAELVSESPILDVSDLHVAYGDFVAVERASFSVNAGECIAIIGPNGNGKSSIALAIAGLIPRKGSVTLMGQKAPRGFGSEWMVRHGLSLVPERRRLFPRLSVADNILLGCYGWTRSMRKAKSSDTFAEALDLFPELKPRLGQLAGTLSGGQQQMVALARGLAARPKILVTDEPCLGLAAIVSKRLYAAIQALNTQGRTIILIEENPARALEISHRVVRVSRGLVEHGAQDIRPYNGSSPAFAPSNATEITA
jgi:branched-chain amino acid transport system ATP-binding protein